MEAGTLTDIGNLIIAVSDHIYRFGDSKVVGVVNNGHTGSLLENLAQVVSIVGQLSCHFVQGQFFTIVLTDIVSNFKRQSVKLVDFFLHLRK